MVNREKKSLMGDMFLKDRGAVVQNARNGRDRKTFFLGSGQCPRRNVDIQRIHDYLRGNGWQMVLNEESADLVVVPTCAYSARKARMSRMAVDRLYRKKKTNAVFVVTGCLPEIDGEKLAQLGGAYSISPKELEKFDELLDPERKIEEFPDPNVLSIEEMVIKDSFLGKFLFRFSFKSDFLKACSMKLKNMFSGRAESPKENSFFLRIAGGCLGQCSYCSIKFAAGTLKSKPRKTVLKEFAEGVDAGYERIVLLGEDCGAYGVDIGTDVVDLLDGMFAHKGRYKVRINDFNAQWLIKYYDRLLPLLKNHTKKIEDLLVPVQSGSNRLLKVMKRPYDINEVKARLLDLREKVPSLKLRTHILVGFPGETENDFKATEQFLDEISFAEVQLFLYDDRPRTEASRMTNKVPRRVAKKRAARIMRKSEGPASPDTAFFYRTEGST